MGVINFFTNQNLNKALWLSCLFLLKDLLMINISVIRNYM